jgi:hypothetical protein
MHGEKKMHPNFGENNTKKISIDGRIILNHVLRNSMDSVGWTRFICLGIGT